MDTYPYVQPSYSTLINQINAPIKFQKFVEARIVSQFQYLKLSFKCTLNSRPASAAIHMDSAGFLRPKANAQSLQLCLGFSACRDKASFQRHLHRCFSLGSLLLYSIERDLYILNYRSIPLLIRLPWDKH